MARRPPHLIIHLTNGKTLNELECLNNDIIEAPFWENLPEYLSENNLKIKKIALKIAGLEIAMPADKPFYIHKKKASSMPGTTSVEYGIGYGDHNGRALIDYITEQKSSHRVYCKIPDNPWAISSSP